MSLTPPISFPMAEKSTGQYTAQLVANDGVTALPAATLTTLKLTVYVTKADGTDTKIRDHQNVLNANNVTLSAVGALVWSIQVLDTTLVEAVPFESHVCVFEWTWPSGAGKHVVVLVVAQIRQSS